MNNLLVRTLSSIVFVAIMVAGLFFSPSIFGGLMLIVMTISLQEFYRMTLGGRYRVQQRIGQVAAMLFFTASLFRNMSDILLALALIALLALAITVIFKKDHTDFGIVAFIYAGLAYICLPFCLTPAIVKADSDFNGWLLLNIFIIIWLCDSGAYCIGTWLGQKPTSKKLAPAISPKKSWWGFWGGLFFGAATGAVLYFVGIMPYALVHCIALGIIISTVAVFGDLFESMWKRYFGIKDSGNLIPGHGGMLDRFDSSLFAIPAAYIYLTLFNLL